MMGPTDDHLPTVDPSIQQHAGRFEWPSWRPGLETLIQVGAAGQRARMQPRSAGCVDGPSGSVFSLLGKETGRGTFPAISRGVGRSDGDGGDVVGGTVSWAGRWGEGGNKAELARVAHCIRSIPMHGDPAAALDCGTLAAAATAARRLWEGGAERQLARRTSRARSMYIHTYRRRPWTSRLSPAGTFPMGWAVSGLRWMCCKLHVLPRMLP